MGATVIAGSQRCFNTVAGELARIEWNGSGVVKG